MAERTTAPVSTRDDYYAGLLAEPSSERGIGDRVRFDHSTGMWHIWNDIRWEPDKTTRVYDLVRQCVFKWISDAEGSGHDIKMLVPMLDLGKKSSVLKSLASMPGIAMTGEEWDLQPNLMGFENGVLDLETLTFHADPKPEWHISRSTGHDWDPDADYSAFTTFIEDITSNDPDVATYVLRLLGYAMTGDNREQKFWMWVGGGSNGKGILARTVTKALGDYAYSPPDTLYMRTKFGSAQSSAPRPELLKLQGARFTFMSEPQGRQFNEEMLKAHSGNDPIEARTLYSARFKTFTPTHKIIFLTNEPPRTDDVGPSMQRRVRVVRFNEDYSPESTTHTPDNSLEPRLQEEANLRGALVAMAVQAHHYLKTSSIPEPAQITDWSRAYIAENDPITAFVDAQCVQDPNAEAGGGEMFKAFRAFCETNGYEDMSMVMFGRAMSSRYERKSRAAGNFYVGIRLKNITDLAEADDDDK